VHNVECVVTKDGSEAAYCSSGIYDARDIFAFQTVDDYTFVVNKAVVVLSLGDVQTTRPPEALIFVKGGAYSHKYQVTLHYDDKVYMWSYFTPDNSVEANGPYINTSQIAATLFRAMTGNAATIITSGAAESNDYGVGAMWEGAVDGEAGGIVSADMDNEANTLGFSFQLRGNVIRVWREEGEPFRIDAGDGNGNTFISTIKDKVKSLNDLPLKAFPGFRIKVAGANNESNDDYYLEYTSDDVWIEVVGDGVVTTLNQTTMPHALIHTGVGTFTWSKVDWSTRIAGDDDTAPHPYFVNKKITDIFYVGSRLGILTEAAYDLSKNKSPFTFYPDTVQTVLATAPISSPVNGGRSISLLRKAIRVDESLFLWAQEAQFRVAADNQPFRVETVENKLATAYSFAEGVDPIVVGTSLYFADEQGDFASLQGVVFSGGKAGPALDVTLHVPSYIPSNIKLLVASSSLGLLAMQSSETPNSLYLYNFIVQGAEVVQSAWQTWTIPEGNILWASIWQNKLWLAVLRTEGLLLGSINLTTSTTDPGETDYLTRLDWRVAEAGTSPEYVEEAGGPTTRLSYYFPITELENLRVVIRTTSENYIRGQIIPIIDATGLNTIIVDGDISEEEFYVGQRVDSFVQLSEFWPRGQDGGAVLYDDVIVKGLKVTHAKTSYYKAEVTTPSGAVETTLWTSQQAGVHGASAGPLVPRAGTANVPVQQRAELHSVTLRNDSPFPSAWQRVATTYSYVHRGARDQQQ
jgi:hypothetical protein